MSAFQQIALAIVLPAFTVAFAVRVASGVETADGIKTLGQQSPTETKQEPITPVPAPATSDPLKVALGERLFHDARLSGRGDRSCASCHDLTTNGSRTISPSRHSSDAPSGFDTTTVFNSALSFRVTWLGVFRSLEEQAEASLRNPQTMDMDVDVAVDRLNADAETKRAFIAAYGGPADRKSLLDALATFERTLLTPGSRFDRYLLGEAAALSAQERSGYQLFKTLGCISCHQGVNIGGNLFQKPGVFQRLTGSDPDVVRVPSLRNVAVTAPYFHDGSAATLDEAIRRMARVQLNSTVDQEQVEDLKAFLGTLTGLYRGRPVKSAP